MGWLSVFSGFILKLTRDQREKKTKTNKPTKQTNQLSRNQQKVGALCWQMLCWCWAKTSQLGILSLDCTRESAHGSVTGGNCHVSTAGAICPCVQLILEAGLWWFQLRCKPALHLVLKYCEVALSSSSNAAGVCKFWMTEQNNQQWRQMHQVCSKGTSCTNCHTVLWSQRKPKRQPEIKGCQKPAVKQMAESCFCCLSFWWKQYLQQNKYPKITSGFNCLDGLKKK